MREAAPVSISPSHHTPQLHLAAPYLLVPVEVHDHGAVRSGGDEGGELHHEQAQHEEAVKEKGVVSG